MNHWVVFIFQLICYIIDNDITNELDNKNYSLGVFIDLSKAFDTVDHNILIKKCITIELEGLF